MLKVAFSSAFFIEYILFLLFNKLFKLRTKNTTLIYMYMYIIIISQYQSNICGWVCLEIVMYKSH